MIIPSNPPTAPSSPTPRAPSLRPTAGRAAAADKSRHIAYIKDIESHHAPPAVVSPSLIVPSFLRNGHDPAVPPRPDEYHPAVDSAQSSPDPGVANDESAKAGRGLTPEVEAGMRLPRYLDRLDPHADTDANMTTQRGSSPPGSTISSLALPRPIAALQALSDGKRLDLTAVHTNPTDALYAFEDVDDAVADGHGSSAAPPVQPSLVSRRKVSIAATIPAPAPPSLFGDEPVPAIQVVREGGDNPQGPASPSPDLNWAATLPHSLHGLRSLGTSTARPPLRPDQLGIGGGMGRQDMEMTRLSPGRTAARAEEGSVAGNSTARHLADYREILRKLGTELSVGGTTARPLGPMGEDGVIRIGDAMIPRRQSERRASALGMRDDRDDDGGVGVGRMDIDELDVEWCWFCHGEFARDDVVLKHLDGDGAQWVCRGCDGCAYLGDGSRWREMRFVGGGDES